MFACIYTFYTHTLTCACTDSSVCSTIMYCIHIQIFKYFVKNVCIHTLQCIHLFFCVGHQGYACTYSYPVSHLRFHDERPRSERAFGFVDVCLYVLLFLVSCLSFLSLTLPKLLSLTLSLPLPRPLALPPLLPYLRVCVCMYIFVHVHTCLYIVHVLKSISFHEQKLYCLCSACM